MALTSSPEHPQPLARVVGAVADWVGRLGEIWVEAQVIEIKRRAAPIQFLTLRDHFVGCAPRPGRPRPRRLRASTSYPASASSAHARIWASLISSSRTRIS